MIDDMEHNVNTKNDVSDEGRLGSSARGLMGDEYYVAFKLPLLLQELAEHPDHLGSNDFFRRDLREGFLDPRARLLLEHGMRQAKIFPPEGWQAVFAPEPVPRKSVPRETRAISREAFGDAERWRAHLLLDSHGHPKDVLGNYRQILTHHPRWAGTWRWDAFREYALSHEEGVTDDFLAKVAEWLMVELRMPANKTQILRSVVHSIARESPVDPLMEYLDALPPWDGVHRLDDWLTTYCGAQGSEATQFIGTQLLCGMLARALEPGCVMRSVVILEGAENTGKSLLVQALGAPWSDTLFRGLDQKESQMRLKGIWVMEWPELDALSRAEETHIKAFISVTHDSYVPKYSNDTVRYPRRTVFVGTTNEWSYLKGRTGNTRFLPVKTGVIDVCGFRRDREQLFQEARHIVTTTQDWWLPSASVQDMLAEEREARRVVNEYEAPLAEWLENAYVTKISWATLAKDFLKIDTPERWKDKALQMQIGQALTAIGWHRTVGRDGTKIVRYWEQPKAEGAVPF